MLFLDIFLVSSNNPTWFVLNPDVQFLLSCTSGETRASTSELGAAHSTALKGPPRLLCEPVPLPWTRQFIPRFERSEEDGKETSPTFGKAKNTWLETAHVKEKPALSHGMHSELMTDVINEETLEFPQPTSWSAQQSKEKF